MPLFLLLIVALVVFCCVAALSLRHARRSRDRATATAPAPAVALAATIGAGLGLGWLARAHDDVMALDRIVAEWGQRHAASWSTDAMEALTSLGDATAVVVLAVILAVAETVRTRNRWVIPFVVLVVGGNALLTTIVKALVDRVRPSLNPIAETLGPSFPSGHSSWSAAFLATAVLLLGRGRSASTRAALTGLAAALAVAIAGTRVLLGVHWLSDVIAGLALGAAWFLVCALAFGGRVLRYGAAADTPARAAGEGERGVRQAT